MRISEIKVGDDYVVKEGSTPSAGSVAFSTLYRFRVTELRQQSNGVRPDGRARRKTWRVVGYKCRRQDGEPLYVNSETGLPVEFDFAPAMVLEPWS